MRSIIVALVVGGAAFAAQGEDFGAQRPVVARLTTPGCQHDELWMVRGHHFVPGRTRLLHYLVPGDRP